MTDELIEEKKKSKPVPVKVVARYAETALVEFQDKGLQRVTVPLASVSNGKVDKEELEMGIPYGLSFESMTVPRLSAEKIAEALHKSNIWTADDVFKHNAQVRGILQKELVGPVLGLIIALARGDK